MLLNGGSVVKQRRYCAVAQRNLNELLLFCDTLFSTKYQCLHSAVFIVEFEQTAIFHYPQLTPLNGGYSSAIVQRNMNKSLLLCNMLCSTKCSQTAAISHNCVAIFDQTTIFRDPQSITLIELPVISSDWQSMLLLQHFKSIQTFLYWTTSFPCLLYGCPVVVTGIVVITTTICSSLFIKTFDAYLGN